MAAFTKLLASITLALLCSSTALAAPWPVTSKHATHRTQLIGRDAGLKLEVFHPESTYETFGVSGLDHAHAKRASSDLKGAALAFVESKLGVASDAVTFKSGFAGEAAQQAFVRQQHNGVPFANAVANVAFNNDGKVVAFGSSFVKPNSIPASAPSVSQAAAISAAENALGGTFNEHPPSVEYLALSDGSVALTHVVQIENAQTGAFFEAFVDAHTNKLLSVTDFVAKATYRVLPANKEILTDGFQTLTDPQDVAASPDGWHSDGTTNTTVTAGNNAIAFLNGAQSSTTPASSTSPELSFVYTQSPSSAPTTANNIHAATVNAFYIVNSVHDWSYRYGFTESAFNFQNANFGKGGAQADRVTISVQDGASINNADFATPPDGQSGRMRMFLWDETSPERDGALENDIVTHENTHGITNRMTGGGTGRCLQTTEAGGMGEGWSDTMANWAEAKGTPLEDFVLGQYVTNDPAGIRSHPYSTSKTVNPQTYATLKTLSAVHDIGEVWANTLHNVLAALMEVHGFSTTARTDPSGTEGNVVFLHLFIDALSLQPCNPTFLTARDAIIQADANRTRALVPSFTPSYGPFDVLLRALLLAFYARSRPPLPSRPLRATMPSDAPSLPPMPSLRSCALSNTPSCPPLQHALVPLSCPSTHLRTPPLCPCAITPSSMPSLSPSLPSSRAPPRSAPRPEKGAFILFVSFADSSREDAQRSQRCKKEPSGLVTYSKELAEPPTAVPSGYANSRKGRGEGGGPCTRATIPYILWISRPPSRRVSAYLRMKHQIAEPGAGGRKSIPIPHLNACVTGPNPSTVAEATSPGNGVPGSLRGWGALASRARGAYSSQAATVAMRLLRSLASKTEGAAATTPKAYVRLARKDEIPALALIAREAFITDPNFSYLGNLKEPLSNEQDSKKRRTLEKFLGMLYGLSFAAGARITVVALPKSEEEKQSGKEELAASCIWLPPHKRVGLKQFFTSLRYGFFTVLRGWGFKGFTRASILHPIHTDAAWGEVWKNCKLPGTPEHEWYLQLAFTAPQHQGHGYLSLLIREMYEFVPEKLLTLDAATPKARDRYAHLGFELQHPWTVGTGQVNEQGLKGKGETPGMTFYSMIKWDPEHSKAT
ncbi:hypothetical protein EVG20_g6103 [Dentipellis fragilis]|uniref:Fungalysin n=1 Tax=Dentipellis fragilis TaxID=205917 RepID=A0A4Y9YQN3_9AGAM|nr:hypothetical protein EVG20_g6103 [Dentipellis fragilis]